MKEIKVDFSKKLGAVKAMHAVGQPPFRGGFRKFDFSPMAYLRDANIPFSRLHDVGGAFGSYRFVDIPNIFRDFDADENDPKSYDFAFTDVLLKAMAQYELKPIFRLGVTIENQAPIKAYRIHPPKDYDKWARICEHIIRHYNEGWADGFNYGIEYWEIWNEPENGVGIENQMWTGTPLQFYKLYDVTAKHLKKCFGDKIKVGGYAASCLCGIFYHPEKYGLDMTPWPKSERYEKHTFRLNFFLGFMDYITEHNSPIDFFSWHSYEDVKHTRLQADYINKTLESYGFLGLETHLNEWNNAHALSDHGTARAGAAACAMLCEMQNSPTDMLFYYDARILAGAYGGFFNFYTGKATPVYYTFKAFGKMFKGTQTQCSCDENGIYTLAAVNGQKKCILISNYSDVSKELCINEKGMSCYIIDESHSLEKVDIDLTAFTLLPNQVCYIEGDI